MADQSQNPILTQNPEDKHSLTTAIRLFLSNQKKLDDNMLPAIVISYDYVKNIATVQPLIQIVTVDDKTVDRAPLAEVQCLALGAGNSGGSGVGFVIHFPIKAGDLGWIFAADRDLSLFRQQLAKCAPPTGRMHQFADSLFVPDIMRKYTLNSGDEGKLCIQTTDGVQRITIATDGNIYVHATTKVTVDTPLSEFTGNVIIDGMLEVHQATTLDATLHVVGNTTMDANLAVTGSITANSGAVTMTGGTANIPQINVTTTATLPSATTVAGKNVNGHVHSDPQGGTTGPF